MGLSTRSINTISVSNISKTTKSFMRFSKTEKCVEKRGVGEFLNQLWGSKRTQLLFSWINYIYFCFCLFRKQNGFQSNMNIPSTSCLDDISFVRPLYTHSAYSFCVYRILNEFSRPNTRLFEVKLVWLVVYKSSKFSVN